MSLTKSLLIALVFLLVMFALLMGAIMAKVQK